MRRIVLDMKGGLLAEAVMQSLSGCDPDFLVYRSSKPEETLALCRSCRANVLVMEVIRQGIWKLSERLKLCNAVKQLGWVCKVLLLVDESADELLAAESLHKISVSLHSFEGNDGADEQELSYLTQVWNFAEKAAKKGVIVALRLWNDGGADERNGEILDFLRSRTGDNWPEMRNGSFLLRDHLYLERAGKFDWPDLSANESGAQFCYGLRDQLGVLVDGTVVPCCLDHEGDMALGNLFTQPLDEILNSPRACALREGFSRRKPAEELCRRCGFAARFNK